MFRVCFVTISCMLLAAFINASPLAKLDSKIVGGANADIKDHPYQVSLEYYGLHICGGTLFDGDFIITAAHCVKDLNLDKLYIRLGTSERNKNGELIKVDTGAVILHPCAKLESPIAYDIAVIKLASPIKDPNVKAIDQLAHEAWPLAGEGTITGWGYTEQGGDLADTLQVASVPLIDWTTCADIYKDTLTDSMICAGDIANGNVDACQGDSGSPLVQECPDIPNAKCIVGVVSWGVGCAQVNLPGVYASIPKADKWLRFILLGLETPEDPFC